MPADTTFTSLLGIGCGLDRQRRQREHEDCREGTNQLLYQLSYAGIYVVGNREEVWLTSHGLNQAATSSEVQEPLAFIGMPFTVGP